MIEYILKKDFNTGTGTLKKGCSIRISYFNGKPMVYYEGGLVGYHVDVLLNLVNDETLHKEYLIDRQVIKNKI